MFYKLLIYNYKVTK